MRKCAEVYGLAWSARLGKKLFLVLFYRGISRACAERQFGEEVVLGVVLSVALPVQDAGKEEKKYS